MDKIQSALQESKRIHFIGIGGSGMCPLAEILHARGYHVTGSDNNESETLERIRGLGIAVHMGHHAQNIEDADMVVYTAALLPNNPELVAAQESGVPTFERSKLLGALAAQCQQCIAVSGTHGKTTTTAMLTQIFLEANRNPSAIIGGKLPATGSNGIAGGSQYMLVEACEYKDTFLKLSPQVALILNVDEDHMEYFHTLENLIYSFHRFAAKAETVIVNGDDYNALQVLPGLGEKTILTFGESVGNDYWIQNVQMKKELPSYDLYHKGKLLGQVHLRVPGRHNVYNATAAIVAAMNEGISFLDCVAGLLHFSGAGRRFEFLADIQNIAIADDYAHHPKELEVTLQAAAGMGYNQVWAVFQPFTYSRTKMLLDDFVRVLQIADHVVLTEIMGSREVNTYDIHSDQLANRIPGAVALPTFDDVAAYVVQHAQPGDLVITLGCGDVYKVAKKIIQGLEKKEG